MATILVTAIITAIMLVILYWAWQGDCFGELLFFFVCGAGIVSCNQSEWHQASVREADAKQAIIDRAEATPHVVREADGCKVYAFKAGNWHYFTRCNDGTVTTESHRNETTGSGKNASTVDVAETIVTK